MIMDPVLFSRGDGQVILHTEGEKSHLFAFLFLGVMMQHTTVIFMHRIGSTAPEGHDAVIFKIFISLTLE